MLPRPVWWAVCGVWLFFFAFPVVGILQDHASALERSGALLATVIVAALYLALMLHRPLAGSSLSSQAVRLHLAGVIALILLVAGLALVQSGSWLWFVFYGGLAAGVALPPRFGTALAAGLVLLTLLVGAAVAGWLNTGRFAVLAGVGGFGMLGLGWLVRTVDELRRAREELARLAVAEERLRFARDLHDLLGHGLSAIALKSELAERLVATAPERAADQMREVAQVARAALHDVRQTVAGYRQVVLATELAGARELLATADIACTVEADTEPVPPAVDAVLAWVVREGVTNVMRHSRARHCAIRVHCSAGAAWAEVVDDGPGDGTHVSAGGSGLVGLTERVAGVGGTLTAGRVPDGYRLRAVVPLPGGTQGRGAS